MKQKLIQMTKDEINQMIILKYHRLVDSQDHPSFVPNHVLGKVFGIDGSSVRRLILK